MPQPDLFGTLDLANPVAHAHDPDTSAEAAQRHTDSGAREAHARLVLRMVRAKPGRTACELWAEATEFQRVVLVEMQEIRRRLVDLEAAGRVRKGEARTCRAKGTRQVVWEVV